MKNSFVMPLASSFSKQVAVGLVRLYQNLFYFVWRSPIGSLAYFSCPMHPDCSAYAVQAIEKHGALRGMYMAVLRVARCRPYTTQLIDEP